MAPHLQNLDLYQRNGGKIEVGFIDTLHKCRWSLGTCHGSRRVDVLRMSQGIKSVTLDLQG